MSYKGTKLSDESKRKIGLANSISLLGKRLPEKVKIKISRSLKGKVKTETHLENIGKALFKGCYAKYATKHQWIAKIKGRPNKCDHCMDSGKKKYEWANIDHKYSRNPDDYIRLCTSCHRKYDYANHLSNKGSKGGSVKNRQVEYTNEGMRQVED